MPLKIQIFSFLFLMLGPFKVIGPFFKLTKNATPELARNIALRGTLYSLIALILAALLGQRILSNYGIPIPILGFSAGLILFLVALLNVIQQFTPTPAHSDENAVPSLALAMNPLAFPTIVTPYGIAAVIMFLAICPDRECELMVGGMVLGIMLLNLVLMLISRKAMKVLGLILPILGAVLGVVQVALGLMIMFNQGKAMLNL
jgi:multiple antibiotic resistance protein